MMDYHGLTKQPKDPIQIHKHLPEDEEILEAKTGHKRSGVSLVLSPHMPSGDLEIHLTSLVQSSWENRSTRNFSVDDFNILYKFSVARTG